MGLGDSVNNRFATYEEAGERRDPKASTLPGGQQHYRAPTQEGLGNTSSQYSIERGSSFSTPGVTGQKLGGQGGANQYDSGGDIGTTGFSSTSGGYNDTTNPNAEPRNY